MLAIEPGLMIYTLFTFGILVLVLRKYAFGPLQNVINQRRDAILESIEAAEQTRRDAEQLLVEYRQSIANSKHEAEEIIERARKVGETTRAEILNQAKDQAQKEVDDARDQIRRETKKAVQEIKSQVADLTILAAEKVTAKTIKPEDHLRLVDEALSEIDFEQLGAGGK